MKRYKTKEIAQQPITRELLNMAAYLKENPIQAHIYFTDIAYYKLWALVEAADMEVAWDGFVTRDKPNVFMVKDIVVMPQTVTPASVDTDDAEYAEWLNSLTDEEFSLRRFNGHSHVKMGVTPSGTDMRYREESIKNVKDFMIYGIFNKKGEYCFEVYDVENGIVYDDEDVVMHTPTPDYSQWAKEQIEENVHKPIAKSTYNGHEEYLKKMYPEYYKQIRYADYYEDNYGVTDDMYDLEYDNEEDLI